MRYFKHRDDIYRIHPDGTEELFNNDLGWHQCGYVFPDMLDRWAEKVAEMGMIEISEKEAFIEIL